jgi:hypothetical protein
MLKGIAEKIGIYEETFPRAFSYIHQILIGHFIDEYLRGREEIKQSFCPMPI